VRHLGLSKVRGSFPDLQGTLLYDAVDPTRSSVTVIINTASLTTANDRRDTDLRQNFFETERFSRITFQSTRVTRSADGLMVDGELHIRDVTQPVTMPVLVLGDRIDTATGERRIAFEGRLEISRKGFGVQKEGHPAEVGLVIADRVEIELQVEAARRSFSSIPFDSRQKPSIGGELERVMGQRGLQGALQHYRRLGGQTAQGFNVSAREFGVLGMRLLDASRPSEAVEILRLGVEVEPRSSAGHEWLGHALMAAGDAPGAAAMYQQALALDSTNTAAIEMLRRLRQ